MSRTTVLTSPVTRAKARRNEPYGEIMKHSTIRLCAVLLALFAAGSAFAQSDSEAPAAGADSETETAADTDQSGLSLGTVEGEVAIGQTYIREEFSSWQLRCVRTEDGKDPCQLYQLLSDGDGNSVAEFNIFPLPEGQQAVAGANVITPLETLLTASLRLAVDGGQPKRYPYSFCSQIGCFSRIGLTAEEVALFRKGAAATITIVPAAAPDETVELGLSLSGFTAGFNALVEADKAARAE